MDEKETTAICDFPSKKSAHNSCKPSERDQAGSWEQYFNAIPDPVLVVRPDGIIIEINNATLLAARKTRDEIVGQGICKVVHGGRCRISSVPWRNSLRPANPR